MSAEAARDRPADEASQLDTRYASYVLGVLVIVYVFNFIDRQILSILNEEIKRDLALSDAEMGFLYGTAFAVFTLSSASHWGDSPTCGRAAR